MSDNWYLSMTSAERSAHRLAVDAQRKLNRQRFLDSTREDRERDRIRVMKWRAKNPGANNAIGANRRAAKMCATPIWADKSKIRAIYAESARRRKLGQNCVVDHIVPLRSDVVCGLHCEANLQIINAIENIKKGNRRWPDMP